MRAIRALGRRRAVSSRARATLVDGIARATTHAFASTSDANESATGSLDWNALLRARRAARGEMRDIDRDGARDAMSSARSVEEMRARAREARVVSARAVLSALRAAREWNAFEGENGVEMSTTFARALLEEASGMSVRSLAQAFHDADRARFEGLPGAELARALARRVEREMDTLSANDVTGAIWGVVNFYTRRSMSEAAREAVRLLCRAAMEALRRHSSTRAFGAGDGSTLCKALQNAIKLSSLARCDVPVDVIAGLVNVAADNATHLSPQQVSFILHDAVSANVTDVFTNDVIEKLTRNMRLEHVEFPAAASLLWSYSKMDAVERELISHAHANELHTVSLAKLESDEVLSSRDIAIHLYATARLGPDYIGFRDVDYIAAACKRLFNEVESLNQRAICMILWAMNTMRPSEDGFRAYPEFLDALSNAALRSVYAFAPHELAPTMHALASLRLTNPKLIELASKRFRGDLTAYGAKPQNMTLMLWSFAALEYDIGASVLREAMHVFLKVARDASALETRTILQSLARLRLAYRDDEYDVDNTRASINAAIERHIDDYTQSDCEVLAWSLLQMSVPASERLLERVGVESIANDVGDVEFLVRKPSDF